MANVYMYMEVDAEQTEEFFRYAGYRARDAREPLRDVYHDIIVRGIIEQFDTEGGRSGGWEPLSKDYAVRKPGGLPILVLTGAMEYHLTGTDDPATITPDSLEWAPHMDLVGWHQFGVVSRTPGGRLPSRPILVWTPEDDEHTHRIFEDWLEETLAANSRRFPGGVRPDTLPYVGGIF